MTADPGSRSASRSLVDGTLRGGAVPFRFFDTAPAPGGWNMALDHALMESVRAGAAPVLRFYRWQPRCLSLGRNQPARGEYSEAALRERGIGVVRRPTGGRAVLHDRELTYSVICADGALGGPRAAYAAINRALVAGLRRLGVPAALQPPTAARAAVPSLVPCFRQPAEGEVVVAGRKLVGSAQYREAGVMLQHGSLLLENSQTEMPELLARPAAVGAVADTPATLAECCGALPSWEALGEALRQGWAAEFGAPPTPESAAPHEAARAEALVAHYSDAVWTWRC